MHARTAGLQTDDSPYEKETRRRFWLVVAEGPLSSYLHWRDMHRATLLRLAADPRVTPAALQAIREHL